MAAACRRPARRSTGGRRGPHCAPDSLLMSRVAYRLGITAAFLAVLLAVLVAALHTTPVRRYALAKVTDILRQQNVTFNTDELSYNLLDLKLRLRNLRIASEDAQDLPPFAHIESADIDLSLTQLLRRRYVVQSGTLDGVRVHYYVAPDGRDNLPRPPEDPDQPSRPLDYLVDALAIRNARVHYENRARNIAVLLPVRSVDIDGNVVNDRHTVQLDAGSGTVRYEDTQLPLNRLVATVDAGEDDLNISQAEADVERSTVALSGDIRNFDAPTGDLAVRGHVD